MAKDKMMPYMTGYSKGYTPPQGSAGAAAFGAYSHKRNPLAVPEKGSAIRASGSYMKNPDQDKVTRMKDEQARKESLRGIGC